MLAILLAAAATAAAAANTDPAVSAAAARSPPPPPPPSWNHTTCGSCLGAGLLWCYYDDKCWTHTDPGDREPQTCALNLDWCAAGTECKCKSCGDMRCQPPAPAPNPPPAPQRGHVEGVHLALGKVNGTMTVAWTTTSAAAAASIGVKFGPAGDQRLTNSAPGDQRPLVVAGSRFTHVATLRGLVPDHAYTYRVDGDSMAFNFTFRRNAGPEGRVAGRVDRHIIFGDLGASHAFSVRSATGGTVILHPPTHPPTLERCVWGSRISCLVAILRCARPARPGRRTARPQPAPPTGPPA